MRDELERAIEDDPDADAPRLVLADWLQQHGDPLGELAVVQHRGAPDRELIARVLGPLDPFLDHLDARWRIGFLDSVRISDWEQIADCAPEDVDDFDLHALLRMVLAHPAARFLRELRFGMTTFDAVPRYSELMTTLLEHALPALRSLELGALDFRGGEMELSWVALGDVGRVARRYPQLRELALAGACVHMDGERLELGELELPELRRFAFRTTDLTRSVLADILAAHWPKLASLTLWLGDHAYGCEVTVEDLEPLLDTPLPLVHLGLGNCIFTDDLIEPLAASDVLPRLRTLDLSCGTLTDRGAATLVHNFAAKFAHLERLVLDRSHLSEAAVRSVARVCPISAADQRELLSSGERYVAVHE